MAQACEALARRARQALKAGEVVEAASWADQTEDMALRTACHVRRRPSLASLLAVVRASRAYRSTRPAVDAWIDLDARERRA
jgi:hypothetical protein